MFLGNHKWTFDHPLTVGELLPDPAFEISPDGQTWYGPSAYGYHDAYNIVYSYPAPAWASNRWRLLTTPTYVNWLPEVLYLPQKGLITP